MSAGLVDILHGHKKSVQRRSWADRALVSPTVSDEPLP